MLTVQFGLAERQAPFIEGRPWQDLSLIAVSSEGIPTGVFNFVVPSAKYKQLEPLFGKAFTHAVALDFSVIVQEPAAPTAPGTIPAPKPIK